MQKMLTDERERAGLTQTTVSLKLGVPQNYVSKIELGLRRIEVIEFIELVEALGLDPVESFKKFIELCRYHGAVEEKHRDEPIRIEERIKFIEEMVERGGPALDESESFRNWLNQVEADLKSGAITLQDLQKLRSALGDVLSLDTLYGHTFQKPHGYAGDYEIIDKIYCHYVSENPRFANWDRSYNLTDTAIAVRNRKDYLVALLQRRAREDKPLNVLNIGSGPARDLYEFFSTGSNNVFVDCVEPDAKAIDYASKLCRDYPSNIKFYHSDISRFRISKEYDLIWSAGLFDYVDDEHFKSLLRRLLKSLAPGGELVIANFSDFNRSRGYMEVIGDWAVPGRSRREIVRLAKECRVPRDTIQVVEEPEGINLFLHIQT